MTASGISNPLNHAGQVISTRYDYNAFGQLEEREVNGLYQTTRLEKFDYDGLNRLKQNTMSYNGIIAKAYYCYDALGNMTTKGSSNACSSSSNVHFDYGNATRSTGNAGVHALRRDRRSGKTFHYDNNGNMITDGSRNLVYSGFDKVTSIRQAGNMAVNFRYGAGHRRYYRKDTYLSGQDESAGKVNKETYYYGAFERISKSSGTVYQYSVGNMLITENLATGEFSHKLLIKDHLGSTLAVSEVNDSHSQASITQAFRYDPFGQQYALEVSDFSVFSAYMHHGFTGHEMLNELNIIHMNGRIYDPSLGRFLQADPFIQAPKNSQNYNRYSYVLNNPLSYTDPSGYFVSFLENTFKKIKKYWKVIGAVAISYFTFGATSGWAASWALGSGFSASAAGFIGAMAGGAAAGFVSGAIMTGSLSGALKGAFIGAATGGIMEGVAQYGFNTSTVGEAAAAMQLEQAGVSRETIMKLYGKGGVSGHANGPNRFNGDTEGLDNALSTLNKKVRA